MNIFDYVLLTIIGLSGLFAALRGFLREMVGLIGWVAAFAVASRFSPLAAAWLSGWIKTPDLAHSIGFFGLFVLVLLLVGLIGQLLKKLAGQAGMTLTDRFFGLFFGLLRGVLMILIGFMFMLHFDIAPPEMVSRSFLSPYFELGLFWLGETLPPAWLPPGVTAVPVPATPPAGPL